MRFCYEKPSEFSRLSGWWGNDPVTRFEMKSEFVPSNGACSWQVSTPSLISMTPLMASLELFEEIGMDALRKKSEMQTAFFLELLQKISSDQFTTITPNDPQQRGCQISLLIREKGKVYLNALKAKGMICDYREPNIIRVTPSPFYTTFEQICLFVEAFAQIIIDQK